MTDTIHTVDESRFIFGGTIAPELVNYNGNYPYGNARNAGLLAIQILAVDRPELLERVQAYRQSLSQMVVEKQVRLDELGYQAYLKEFLGDRG